MRPLVTAHYSQTVRKVAKLSHLTFNEAVVMAFELTTEQIQQALLGISVPPQPQIMVDLQMEQYMIQRILAP